MTDVNSRIETAITAFERAEGAQRLAADPLHSAWVEANAGSGKTKVLIDRVARLLLQRPDGRPGSEPDSILCITYTKAAANEMLSRLFDRLGRWSTQTDAALRETLAALEDRPPESFERNALDRARSLFARALETPGGLRIETIHAFCARILRRFPLEAGISPGFSEMDDDLADQLWQTCLQESLSRVALEHADAFRTISDAAGGRGVDFLLEQLRYNRIPIQRFQRRLNSEGLTEAEAIREALTLTDETPESVLKQTMQTDFPREQIRMAIEEIRHAVDPKPDKDKTNKRFAASLQDILDSDDSESAFNTYLRVLAGSKRDWSLKGNPYTGKQFGHGLVANLFRRKRDGHEPEGTEIVRLKAADATYRNARTARQTIALAQIGLPIVDAYQSAKQARGALDFDDLIEHTRSLFVEKAAADWVLYKLDGSLSHILLDEAQDTSPDQWELINAIADEFDAGVGAHDDENQRTKFIVGDPKQSIYSFQGADQDAFTRQRERFAAIATQTETSAQFPEMQMSFRSTPEVLSFVDAVRTTAPMNASSITDFDSDGDQISPHEAKRDTQNGRVELWPLVMPEETPADSSWDVPVDHIAPTDPSRQLANKIADQIVLMLQNGDAVWHEGPGRNWTQRPMTAGDVLILVRRRSAIFKMLIGALESRNLPVAGADRLWLNESLAVQDCLNLIRFTLQPGDDLTLAEILRGPFCNLVEDDRHLFTLAHNRQPGETLWSRLDQAPTQPLQAARAFCHELLSLRHSGPFSFLSQVLDRSLIGNGTGWAQLIKRFGEPARNPIEELVSRALKQEQSESVSLQKFLSTLDTEQIELKRELGEAGDTIRVMTVHGAKGLQSPIVILPDTTNRTRKTQTILFFTETGRPLFSPSAAQDCAATALLRAAENDAQEKESRRLLYVALTRAQDRLIICGAGTKRPQSGFDNSSWYRWCLRGMGQAIRASVFEEAQEEILSIGKPIAQLGRAHLQDERQNELPAWLNHKTFTDAFAPKKTIAPSRLSFTHSETKLEISQARRFAMHRGEIIHTLLQLVPELPSLRWRSEVRAYLDQTPDLTDDQRTEILTVTMATLADPEISNLLSRSGRSEVPISGHLPNGDPISGRIDRLCISAESILILDYKTDRPAPAGVSEIGQDYTLQLAAYSHIVKELYPSRSVSAALLYTEGPKLFRFGADELSVSLNRYANTV